MLNYILLKNEVGGIFSMLYIEIPFTSGKYLDTL